MKRGGSRRYRLTGIGAYDALFKTGRRIDGSFLQLIILPARLDVGRAGYAVPKKLMPLAVDRNRVRRVLREAVRATRPAVLGVDLVFRLRRPCPRAEVPVLAGEARRMLVSLADAS